MLTEQPASPATSSTTSSALTQTAEPDISPPGSPCSARSAPLLSDIPLPLNNPLPEPTPREARSYMPHVVGLGILSPRTNVNTLSQLHREPVVSPSARISPSVQRHNPFESPLQQQPSANVFSSPQHRPINIVEGITSAPPPSPSLAYVEASAANATLSPEPTSPGAQRPPSPGANAIGLRIPIPSHHPGNPFVHGGALSPPPYASTMTSTIQGELETPIQTSNVALDLGEEIPFPQINPNDMAQNVDFAEFDSEGLSALEKIYLFSRSRASFQRVFITHALPGFLRSAYRASSASNNQEDGHTDETQLQEGIVDTDVITPAEAVEYVLPLLNGLAMDEDETVKEALAAELVPVIWWFITHCKLVEFEPSTLPVSPSSQPEYEDGEDHPILISVQAFTPILGTLLLSPNGMVGGPARFAVVELLNRVRRADEKENGRLNLHLHLPTKDDEGQTINREEDRGGTSESSSHPVEASQKEDMASNEGDVYSPVGLFGLAERKMFEREMVQQVVIGMGRLDMPDDGTYRLEEGTGEIADTTSVPTPHAVYGQAQVETDSYFPHMPTPAATEAPLPEVELAEELPPLSVESTGSTAGPDFAALSSPAILSPVPSPAVSPASDPSTPSLTSTSPSSSSTTSETLTPTTPPIATQADLSPLSMQSSPLPPSPPLEGHAHGQHEEWQPLSPGHLSLEILSPRLMTQNDLSPRLSSVRLPTSPQQAITLSPVSLIPRPLTPPLPSSVPLSEMSSDNTPSSDEEAATSAILSPRPESASTFLPAAFERSDEEAQIVEEDVVDDAVLAEFQLREEASVGRLSSMSLMAAVTASGSISDETKAAFVTEVERVGRDSVYWVRREACFAIGALAKVVTQEIVVSSLLPLLQDLCRDTTWHVRHSALFALPAILSRLSPEQRRTLALDVLLTLAHDDVPSVRAGVLEALAEVIHTFHEDPEGPPDQLTRLFLGIREDDDPRKVQNKQPSPELESTRPMSWSEFMASVTAPKDLDVYEDPSRPLVCAFNYPAVALTLGRDRWPELRDLYRELAQNASFKVRRTLAASLGVMAKIIGPEHSKQDLLPVWWSSACSQEGEVRLKAIECLELFMNQLAVQDRAQATRSLEGEIWDVLKGWRERESVMLATVALVKMDGPEPEVLRRLLKKGLVDPVATVREAAISLLSSFVSSWSSRPALLEELWRDLHKLGTSSSYRERMTFVACYQEMVLSSPEHATFFSDIVLGIFSELSCDRIVDVRIRLARLLGVIQEKAIDLPDSVSRTILHLAEQLMYDSSHDVRAFAEPVVRRWPSQVRVKVSSDIVKSTANFSRPPPLAPGPS